MARAGTNTRSGFTGHKHSVDTRQASHYRKSPEFLQAKGHNKKGHKATHKVGRKRNA